MCIAILVSAPPARPYSWPRLLGEAGVLVGLTMMACAVAMFLVYTAFPSKADSGRILHRTAAIAGCLAPLVILLRQRSILAPLLAAFVVWSITPGGAAAQPPWKKFLTAFCASVLLQFGIAAALGEKSVLSSLTVGLAAAPILWRIRQERDAPPPRPASAMVLALLVAVFSLTPYLPLRFSSASVVSAQAAAAPPAFS